MKILKFYADWCGPCKQLTKILGKFLEAYSYIEVISINVEEDEEISEKYNITSIPTLVILDSSDNELRRRTGVMSLEDLKDFIFNT